MKYSWFRRVFPIAILFSFRMLGLFMLIPVFTLLASQLQHATPRLIGLAMGSYGLTQGFLQIPLGLLSDRWGRKPVLVWGLIIFVVGSFIGAVSDSIAMIILARVLQGMGAIGGVLIALLTDLTSEKERTKAMALIGLTIGVSFGLAMVISPLVAAAYGLNGIFYFAMVLGLVGLVLLHWYVPNPDLGIKGFEEENQKEERRKQKSFDLFKTSFMNKQLQCLNAGIFFQHMILTATFFAIPLLLKDYLAQAYLAETWRFYFFLMLISFLVMIPFVAFAEKKHQMKITYNGAVFITAVVQGLLVFFSSHWFSFCCLMLLYFIAFNILEACLPSLVSKQASSNNKGTAMGIYSTSQFLGIFVGGVISGFSYSWGGTVAIFIANAFFGIIWMGMNSATKLSFSKQETNALELKKLL